MTGALRYLRSAVVGLLLIAAAAPSAVAATNAATGGIGGIDNGTLHGGDGTGPAQITLNVTGLALVKQARDVAGNLLPENANVVSGQEIYFVLFVDNPSPYSADDLRITDQLNETEFTYLAGSLELTVVPAGSGDGAIWSGTWNSLSDTQGGPDDGASILDTGGPVDRDRLTVGAVPGQTNQAVDIPADSLLAVRFRVRVN
ncbi:MAG: hypothetical protein JSV26_04240 [bacterium]|nr:MAG: hypothetical protein JSV26_04240 [bacterium]